MKFSQKYVLPKKFVFRRALSLSTEYVSTGKQSL